MNPASLEMEAGGQAEARLGGDGASSPAAASPHDAGRSSLLTGVSGLGGAGRAWSCPQSWSVGGASCPSGLAN